jgi:diguanylate cyclase (GGDEF)-like protein
MISLKKYIDAAQAGSMACDEPKEEDLASVTIAAYRSALSAMGSCSLDACPALGRDLKRSLGKLDATLSATVSSKEIGATDRKVCQQLQDWGKRTANYHRRQTGEVKELLIVMVRTAESLGERDLRCAGQINEVTTRLGTIASLEDLTQIRSSIVKSAAELKTSIDRMMAESKAAVDELRAQVSTYQVRLEEAEQIASRDALTGLGSRLWVEGQIEHRISSGLPLCVAIIDLDGFKPVNDKYGHLVGDELLQQFATELQSVCRSTDLIGRWGGDEFIILLDCGMAQAKSKIDRLREWVCGSYKVEGKDGPVKLEVVASIGLAEHMQDETMKGLLARADADMYREKAYSRALAAASKP